jgi:hypothetical protein
MLAPDKPDWQRHGSKSLGLDAGQEVTAIGHHISIAQWSKKASDSILVVLMRAVSMHCLAFFFSHFGRI